MSSLLSEALNARAQVERGNLTPARGQLNALLDDTAAQSRKHLSARRANLLTGDIRYVLAQLG